jgi:hypothetical protein
MRAIHATADAKANAHAIAVVIHESDDRETTDAGRVAAARMNVAVA